MRLIGPIQPLLADTAHRHEAGVPQQREMLRHARVAEVEPIDELTDRQLLTPYVAQDLLAAWLSDELESVHSFIVARSETYATFTPSLK